MPSPFAWDTTKPAGGDSLNQGDDQLRTDKTTVRDVLRTLVPYGTPTHGWRNVQISNDNYLVQNAKFDGTNWSHDDTTLDAIGFKYLSTGEVQVVFRKAAASTWTSSAWLLAAEFKNIASAVNYLQLLAAATGGAAEILALGADPNIDLRLTPKGTGKLVTGGDFEAKNSVTVLDRDVTAAEVVNTTVETDAYSFSVPGGTLGSNRGLRLVVFADFLNNTGANQDSTVRVKYGGTTFATVQTGSMATSATRRPIILEAVVLAANAANAQVAHALLHSGTTNVSGTAAATSPTSSLSGHNAIAVDSTLAQNLVVSIQHAVGSANLAIKVWGVRLELLR